ncbi:hypothetical protein E2C01_089998 [Portunus trituberculatus]|uniref:Uncharacterized protein n=1 Tax=Portunus trituberculatus TaxID=210409 RepID=A0A5B7JF19_PORTR|nr:hypothetical protein [Portunus trituberculatus]
MSRWEREACVGRVECGRFLVAVAVEDVVERSGAEAADGFVFVNIDYKHVEAVTVVEEKAAVE